MTQSFNQYSENETKIWRQNILNQFNGVSSFLLRNLSNINFKAATGKKHKGEQFHRSSNGSAKNSKMAIHLVTSLESWLGGLSRKRIVYIDFTFN